MMAPPRVMRYRIAARRHFHASERPIGWPKWTALGLASAHLSCHHHRRSGWASGSRVNDFEGARHSCAGRLDRHCVSDSRRDGLPCDLGGDLDHGALGASQADRLWTAGEERLWLEILGRRSLRLCRRLSFAFGDFSCRRILAGLLGASRRRARARNRALAAGFSGHRFCRRVFFPRLPAIHFDPGDGLLARCVPDFLPLRGPSLFHQALRTLARLGLHRSDRAVALPDAAPHRRSALRHRIPCGVRFWRNFCLLRPQRRPVRPGSFAERDVSRQRLAHRRQTWPGSEPPGISRDYGYVFRFSLSVPRPRSCGRPEAARIIQSVEPVPPTAIILRYGLLMLVAGSTWDNVRNRVCERRNGREWD